MHDVVLFRESFCKSGLALFHGDGWGAYDNGLSNAYLVLQARAMGFDTLIMGIRDSDGLRSLFGIPSTETVMAVISLGYRAENPERSNRRDFDDFVTIF